MQPIILFMGIRLEDSTMDITKNSRLESMAKHLMKKTVSLFESTGKKQRVFGDIIYAVDSWKYEINFFLSLM